MKEEVVAPFWANNTRGEVLALLNLYPFEQYVHWEKCTQEHKQMYCRDGCRWCVFFHLKKKWFKFFLLNKIFYSKISSEQQYRLHRLLAYDPHNECRGIFSDWFRFPSCCICKCYNIPFEYRVTSRSPRSMGKNIKYDESDDRMDHDLQDEDFELEDGDEEEDGEHINKNWYRKKRYLSDDFETEMFNDEIEF